MLAGMFATAPAVTMVHAPMTRARACSTTPLDGRAPVETGTPVRDAMYPPLFPVPPVQSWQMERRII